MYILYIIYIVYMYIFGWRRFDLVSGSIISSKHETLNDVTDPCNIVPQRERFPLTFAPSRFVFRPLLPHLCRSSRSIFVFSSFSRLRSCSRQHREWTKKGLGVDVSVEQPIYRIRTGDKLLRGIYKDSYFLFFSLNSRNLIRMTISSMNRVTARERVQRFFFFHFLFASRTSNRPWNPRPPLSPTPIVHATRDSSDNIDP